MNRDRHRLTALGHDVVTTMNAIKLPARGFQPCNDFLARHTFNDRSKTIYLQNADHGCEVGVFPLASLKQSKYWTPIGCVDNVYGDRNLFCSCVPVSDYT